MRCEQIAALHLLPTSRTVGFPGLPHGPFESAKFLACLWIRQVRLCHYWMRYASKSNDDGADCQSEHGRVDHAFHRRNLLNQTYRNRHESRFIHAFLVCSSTWIRIVRPGKVDYSLSRIHAVSVTGVRRRTGSSIEFIFTDFRCQFV